MSFGERMGFSVKKELQVDNIDTTLKNRIYNYISYRMDNEYWNCSSEIRYILDKLGERVYPNRTYGIDDLTILFEKVDVPWYYPYEILEYYAEIKRKEFLEEADAMPWETYSDDFIILTNEINEILSKEKSGYRMVEGKLVSIIEPHEISAIEEAINNNFEPVSTAMKKAFTLYADREKPDYENSIKESITAVEAMCCTITETSGSSATLGNVIKKLKDHGIIIHGAMERAFSNLYGYTSDADGIRHGGMNFINAPAEDAKYMLVSCSAFVNYLMEKYSQIGGN